MFPKNPNLMKGWLAVAMAGALCWGSRVAVADCGQFTRYNLISETSAAPGFNQTNVLHQVTVAGGKANNAATVLARGVTDQANSKNFGVQHATFLEVTAGPETHNHWHYHKGILFVSVRSGTFNYFTLNIDGSCTEHSFAAGESFVVPSGVIHVDANAGSETSEVLVYGIMEDENFGASDGLGFAINASEAPSGPGCPEFGITANSFCLYGD